MSTLYHKMSIKKTKFKFSHVRLYGSVTIRALNYLLGMFSVDGLIAPKVDQQVSSQKICNKNRETDLPDE